MSLAPDDCGPPRDYTVLQIRRAPQPPEAQRAIAGLPPPEMALQPSLAASEIGTNDPLYSSYHMPSQADGVMRSDKDQVLYCSREPDYPCVIYRTSAMECLKVGSVASQIK